MKMERFTFLTIFCTQSNVGWMRAAKYSDNVSTKNRACCFPIVLRCLRRFILTCLTRSYPLQAVYQFGQSLRNTIQKYCTTLLTHDPRARKIYVSIQRYPHELKESDNGLTCSIHKNAPKMTSPCHWKLIKRFVRENDGALIVAFSIDQQSISASFYMTIS